MVQITSEQYRAIQQVPYFRQGIYADLDVEKTLDYMTRRYVEPVAKRLDITNAIVADCAAGFGWVSFAFLQAGAKKAYVIEPEKHRLEAAREIAKILGLNNRCEFICALLEEVDLPPDSVDIFACIETLEHVGKPNVKTCLETMASVTKSVLLLTTPNRIFPVVAHDTKLPFAHWMPAWLRKPYSRAFRREKMDFGNYFIAPWALAPLHRKFKPDAQYTMFSSLEEFDEFYPHYLPYGRSESARYRKRPSTALRLFVSTAGRLFGNYAFSVSPNLATVWTRRN